MKERIRFEFDIRSEFWDKFPMIEISVDDRIKCTKTLDQKQCKLSFEDDLEFDRPHTVSLKRFNKTDDQCVIDNNGSRFDQYVILNQVCIDGIDVQNLIWHRSWFEPIYSTVWKQQQIDAGVALEEKIIGETWLSHNGTWKFEFFSPFYKFIISQFE